MEMFLIVGSIVGTILYFSKAGLFYLLTKPIPRFRKFVHSNMYAMATMDICFGYISSHALGSGSIISIIATTVFGAWTMSFIFINLGKKWFKNKTEALLSW